MHFALPAALAVALGPVVPANAAKIRVGEPLGTACKGLKISDACSVIAESARMLGPTYEKNKATDGVNALRALGFTAQYYPARGGTFRSTTDVFLATRPGSNRLFVVITGTESLRDWYENARFGSYTITYEDGRFYVPPGHKGFRGGLLNLVRSGVVRENEFDQPLDCARPAPARSGLASFICAAGLPTTAGAIETIVVGHSRGAAIAALGATMFDGWELVRQKNQCYVAKQTYWPLRVGAVIAFSPPHAVYGATDAERGVRDPNCYVPALPNHWDFLERNGLIERTVAFLDEEDVVPLLALGLGRQFGHRFRIRRKGDAVVYDGHAWRQYTDVLRAHSSHYYCHSILASLGEQGRCPDKPNPMQDRPR